VFCIRYAGGGGGGNGGLFTLCFFLLRLVLVIGLFNALAFCAGRLLVPFVAFVCIALPVTLHWFEHHGFCRLERVILITRYWLHAYLP